MSNPDPRSHLQATACMLCGEPAPPASSRCLKCAQSMSAQHTPAPWFVVRYGDGESLVICSDQAGNHRIAFMAVPSARDEKARTASWRIIKADAHVIAVAPELLWFAEQIFAGLDTGMLKIDTVADEALTNVLHRGRAALAKVKGGKS